VLAGSPLALHPLRQCPFRFVQRLGSFDGLTACLTGVSRSCPAFAAQLQFELGKAGKHTSHHPTRRVRYVDAFAATASLGWRGPSMTELARLSGQERTSRWRAVNTLGNESPSGSCRDARLRWEGTLRCHLAGVPRGVYQGCCRPITRPNQSRSRSVASSSAISASNLPLRRTHRRADLRGGRGSTLNPLCACRRCPGGDAPSGRVA
jgi:hypothetical protein